MKLLTDEIKARIGETRSYTAPEPLSRASMRYYAEAVGDGNRLYVDDAAARAAGLPGVVAPPTLLCDSNQYACGARDADGYRGHSWHLDVPGTRTVRGGNDYVFHRHAYPDDTVTVTWRLADVTQRTNSRGRAMLIVTSEATVTGDDGDPILTNTETLIHVADGGSGHETGQTPAVPEAAARQPAAPAATPDHGAGRARPRPGAQAPPLDRAITLTDMIVYAGATWDWHRLHYDTGYLAGRGLAAPVVDGQMFAALLVAQAQNWLGTRAFVRRLNLRFKNPVFAGESIRCTAAVTSVDTVDAATVIRLDAHVDVTGPDPRPAVSPAALEVVVWS